MQLNLRKVAVKGGLAIGAAQAANAALQAAFIVILARLLSPADFGLTAMVFPIVFFVTMLQEGGLTSAVIQRETISHRELSSLFWINAAIGLALALLLCAGAPLVATFYHEPRVEGLTMASGGLVLLGALAVQHLALLNRNMHYGRMAFIDVTAAFVGFIVAIAVAAAYHSYWAIWLRGFVTIAMTFVLAWLLSGWTPGRLAPVSQIRDLIGFGGNMTAFSLCNYASRNLDNVLIGKFSGEVSLGLYDRAYRIVTLPLLLINAPLNRIITPVLSRTRDQEERYRNAFLSTLQMGLLVTVPLMSFIAGNSKGVILLLLGPDWIDAAPICAWLSVATLLQLAGNPMGWLYISQGRSRDLMLAGVANSMFICLAFVAGLPWGALGVAKAYAFCAFLSTPLLFWWATRRGPVSLRNLVGAISPFALVAGCCLVVVHLLQRSRPDTGLLFLMELLTASYATMVLTLSVTRTGRSCLAQAWSVAVSGFSMMQMRKRSSYG
ncbi:lipopolysaccharide biosynthesis protein [Sphingomonas oleivorans]|uniref:lipopolysaccharide biosynthesis protein n=1 Tax=Sphingomonas oleivorans TaxID=1735121 RepID=UPI0013FE3FF2|nr:lipopolysaccharide biosynthesis protein [Sphingomonas oleivorans]